MDHPIDQPQDEMSLNSRDDQERPEEEDFMKQLVACLNGIGSSSVPRTRKSSLASSMLTELPEDEEEGDPMIGVESKKSSVSLEDKDDGEAGDLMVGVESTKSMVSSEDDGGEPRIGEPMIGIESTKSSVSLEDEGEGDPVASKQSSLDSDSSKPIIPFEPRRSPRNHDPTNQLILPLDVTPRLSSKKKKPVFTKGGIVLDVNN